MPFNLISPLVDSLTGTAMEVVDAASAAPLNPVTLALAVAAGLVLGLLVMRVLSEVMGIADRCAQLAGEAVTNKVRQRALVSKASPVLPKIVKGNGAATGMSPQ